MSDLYVEHMIKRKTPAGLKAARTGLMILSAAAVLLILIRPVFFLPAIVLIGVTAILPKRWDVEYEYLYVNGEIDFDAIMGAAKRKKKLSINVHELELMAPFGSGSLRPYEQQKLKTYDFSSGDRGQASYVMVIKKEQERIQIIFEPNAEIIEGIRRLEPGKVMSW